MTFSIERQLPEELLDRVVSLCSEESLPKLCLTSRRLNRIATPHLYSRITLGTTAWDGGLSHTRELSRLLFTSESHANLVTSVYVAAAWEFESGNNEEEAEREKADGHENVEKTRKTAWALRTQDLEAHLNNHLSQFALSDKDKNEVVDKVKTESNEDVTLALLLFCLPNLQRVDMNFGFSDQHEEFVSVFELLAESVQDKQDDQIPRLDVMVKGDDDKYPNLPVHLAALLHLRTLRSIYAWKMGDHEGDPDLDFARLKPRSSPVEYIELRTSKLHKENLGHLMAATIPGKLKTFNYEIGCTWAWCDITHPGIMTSLQAHHKTLEGLGLSHEDFYPHQFDNDSEEPYPCDFTPFTALRRLKVAPCYIWGHEGFNDEEELSKPETQEMLWKTLPPNLEQLWVCRADPQAAQWDGINDGKPHFEYDCLLPALHLVLEHVDRYSKLKNIRLEFSPLAWSANATFDTLATFCQDAKRIGIACTVILTDIYVPSDKGTYPTGERGWGWDEDVDWGDCFANQEAEKIWIDATISIDLARDIRGNRDRTLAARQKS